MDFNLLLAFVAVCLVETLMPGPTLALVVDTRINAGKPAAMATVAGITIANILWVAFALLVVFANATWFDDQVSGFIQDIGAAYLIYLASRRLLALAASLFSPQDDASSKSMDGRNAFWDGFIAHAANPLSVAFYIATFSLTVTGFSLQTAMIFGAVPIVIDLALFTLLAAIPVGAAAHVPRSLARFLAGLFLLYLVGQAYSNSSTATLSMTPITALMMLIGFYIAAIVEAKHQVRLRKGESNKLVWRVVALWGAWFSVAALLGGLYTLIGGFGISVFSLDASTEHRIRICFVVAAVLATALSFAKAYGELQDEKFPQNSTAKTVSSDGWKTAPLQVGVAVMASLLLVFILLWTTDFRVN